jgi:hypothetical protein
VRRWRQHEDEIRFFSPYPLFGGVPSTGGERVRDEARKIYQSGHLSIFFSIASGSFSVHKHHLVLISEEFSAFYLGQLTQSPQGSSIHGACRVLVSTYLLGSVPCLCSLMWLLALALVIYVSHCQRRMLLWALAWRPLDSLLQHGSIERAVMTATRLRLAPLLSNDRLRIESD